MNRFQSIIEQTQQHLLGIMLILNTVTRLILEYLIFFPFFSLTIEMHFQIRISFLCIYSTSYRYIQVGHLLLRPTFLEVFFSFQGKLFRVNLRCGTYVILCGCLP